MNDTNDQIDFNKVSEICALIKIQVGHVIERKTRQGVESLKVEVWNKDRILMEGDIP